MSNSKNDKYITLKEAAEISGYSPDYLGQLIRNGKLKGEQVFSNVAWMTTEEAVLSYVKKKKKKDSLLTEPEISRVFGQTIKQILAWDWGKIYTRVLYAVIALMVLFIIFLFFIFSVNFEKKMEINTEKELLLNTDSGVSQ